MLLIDFNEISNSVYSELTPSPGGPEVEHLPGVRELRGSIPSRVIPKKWCLILLAKRLAFKG